MTLVKNAWFWFGIFLIILYVVVSQFLMPLAVSSALSSIKIDPPVVYPNEIVPVTKSNEQKPIQVQKTAVPQSTTKQQITKPVKEIQPTVLPNDKFDTNNCQYPDRLYPNGNCDNSDPACPETLKDPLLKGNC